MSRGNAGAAGYTPASDGSRVVVDGGWTGLLQRGDWSALEQVLPSYLRERRWFGGKARQVIAMRVRGALPLPSGDDIAPVILVEVEYAAGAPETYTLPVAYAVGEHAAEILERQPDAVIASLAANEEQQHGILYDALHDRSFRTSLLEAIARNYRNEVAGGTLLASTTGAFDRLRGPADEELESSVVRAEQSNTSVIYGDRLILKLFRRVESGTNPDLEIGRFLTDRVAFANIPPVAGAIEFRPDNGEPSTLAILQGFVANQGDAWQYTLEELASFYDRVQARGEESPREAGASNRVLLDLAEADLPPHARDLLGAYAESARLLGQRTAEMHLALAADATDPAFAPEPFTAEYQRTLHESLRLLATQVFRTLQDGLSAMPAALQEEPRAVLSREQDVFERFRPVVDHPVTALRTRYHGDYHLGQVLFSGSDFFIIDFEGEPARPLSERRGKRSALQDVAGLLRSLHYAAYAALMGQGGRDAVDAQEFSRLEPWAKFWHRWTCVAFLRGYFTAAGQAAFLPRDREELSRLLDIFLLEKAVYEMGYELNNRPTWVRIPAQGILQILGGTG